MDPGTVGVFIPIAAIVAWGADRIATIQAEHKKGADPDTSDRLEALENEVGTLRQELGEAQERLDFTERLLASSGLPSGWIRAKSHAEALDRTNCLPSLGLPTPLRPCARLMDPAGTPTR